MAATATYTTAAFDLDRALGGTPVTFLTSIASYTDFEAGTGMLRQERLDYSVTIDGTKYHITRDGTTIDGLRQLYLAEAVMTTTYGTEQEMTRGAGAGLSDPGAVSTLEPRDQFAIVALQSMMNKLQHAECANDSTIIMFTRASYRWAQGMMIAAADAHAGTSGSGGDTASVDVDVSGGTTSEKLLNNIVASLKNLTDEIKAQLNTNKTQATSDITQMKEALTLALGRTLKVDNPSDDTFDVKGVGGSSSLNRSDVNDAGQSVSDILVYNAQAGNAPMRVTLANLYAVLKVLMDSDFDAKGAADTALASAKNYTDQKIAEQISV